MTVESMFFALLRNAVCHEKLNSAIEAECTPEMLEDVYKLAYKHDLAHLVGYAIEQMNLPESDALTKLKTAKLRAIYRFSRLDYEFERICDVLEELGVPFIPLKGSVLRTYYPEPWMRTSCDIDILVKEDALDAVVAVLEERLRYSNKGKSDHDVSMFSENGVHLELHYVLIAKELFSSVQDIFATSWENTENKQSKKYQRVFSDEMFYLYHVVHMAKHIENGGCGIRPFLDMWILNHRVEHDCQKRKALLDSGKLLKFATAAEKLSEIWFSGAAMDEMSQKLERYVLDGGTYGNWENQVSVKHTKMGGKVRYVLRKIFLPYNRLQYHYPIIQKYKILTPVFEVVRWHKLLFKGGVKRSVKELRINAGVSGEERVVSANFLNYLGLTEKE